MIYFLVFLVLLLLSSTIFFAYQTFRFAKMILGVQDLIEDSLKILDSRIESVTKILEIPLFFDSPEIRRVHEDIRASREALIKIAQSFSKIEEDEGEDE